MFQHLGYKLINRYEILKIYTIIFVKKKKCEQWSANYYLSAIRSNQTMKQLFVLLLLSDISK